MTVSDDVLAGIIANLRPAATPAPARTRLGTCRATGCTEKLDPILIDDPAAGTGLHVMCAEPATPGPVVVQPVLEAPVDLVSTHPVDNQPPPSTVAELRDVLADFDADRPRSRQIRLGPSELGTPCQRQIAYKLIGAPRQPPTVRPLWAPMQGTAIHALMEEALRFHNRQLGRERWVIEEQLHIDEQISGHGDAFDTDTGTVVDWKHAGATTLRDVKRKTIPNDQLVKPDYRVQAHLYGYGHQLAGRDVRWVRLVFLARSHNYDDSAEWTERYDPDIAISAIARYYGTHDLIRNLALAETPALWPAVPAAPGKACSWCPFRRPGMAADQTGCPGDTASHQRVVDRFTDGLIAR